MNKFFVSFGKRMGQAFGRHHAELGAVVEDATTEVGEVGQASGFGFDVLEQRVEAFASSSLRSLHW